jgi:alpha-ketoglutarate-dependent taurine dioxygenase
MLTPVVHGEVLQVDWSTGHKSSFPSQFLERSARIHFGPRQNSRRHPPPLIEHGVRNLRALPSPPQRGDRTSLASAPFNDLIESDQTLHFFLAAVVRDGLALVTDAPREESTVLQFASRVAQPQPTIYGAHFDVVATPRPINVAYSNVPLDLHQDLAYYQSPPGLQLLHCLRFDCSVRGGASTFVDAFDAAARLRAEAPEAFGVLTRVAATFQKIHFERERPVVMEYSRPHIAVDGGGEVVGVAWAPAFEGALRCRGEEVERYYSAYEKFGGIIRRMESEGMIEFRMREGDIVVFNNLRMLHGRTGFSSDGIRHFRGCYVNIDEFGSAYRVLCSRLGKEEMEFRIGNGSLF